MSRTEPLLQPQDDDFDIHLPPAASESAHFARRAKYDLLQCNALISLILDEEGGDLTCHYTRVQRAKIMLHVNALASSAEWECHRAAIKRSIDALRSGVARLDDYLGRYVREQLELYIANDCNWNWIVHSLASDAAEDMDMYRILVVQTKKQAREYLGREEVKTMMKAIGLTARHSPDIKEVVLRPFRWVREALGAAFHRLKTSSREWT